MDGQTDPIVGLEGGAGGLCAHTWLLLTGSAEKPRAKLSQGVRGGFFGGAHPAWPCWGQYYGNFNQKRGILMPNSSSPATRGANRRRNAPKGHRAVTPPQNSGTPPAGAPALCTPPQGTGAAPTWSSQSISRHIATALAGRCRDGVRGERGERESAESRGRREVGAGGWGGEAPRHRKALIWKALIRIIRTLSRYEKPSPGAAGWVGWEWGGSEGGGPNLRAERDWGRGAWQAGSPLPKFAAAVGCHRRWPPPLTHY